MSQESIQSGNSAEDFGKEKLKNALLKVQLKNVEMESKYLQEVQQLNKEWKSKCDGLERKCDDLEEKLNTKELILGGLLCSLIVWFHPSTVNNLFILIKFGAVLSVILILSFLSVYFCFISQTK